MSAPYKVWRILMNDRVVSVTAGTHGPLFENETAVLYLRADLTCGECKHSMIYNDCHHFPARDGQPACMDFSPKET